MTELAQMRKERDFLVAEYERAVKCGSLGYAHAAMHIYNAVVNAKCDANAQRFLDLLERAEKAERRMDKFIKRIRVVMKELDKVADGMVDRHEKAANFTASIVTALKKEIDKA